jgi:hypothetical protein
MRVVRTARPPVLPCDSGIEAANERSGFDGDEELPFNVRIGLDPSGVMGLGPRRKRLATKHLNPGLPPESVFG